LQDKLIEYLNISKEWRVAIAVATIAIPATASATYFSCDKFLFSERSLKIKQLENDLIKEKDNARELNELVKEWRNKATSLKDQNEQFEKELNRLKPYEKALPDWKAAHQELQSRVNKLSEANTFLDSEIQKGKLTSTTCGQELMSVRQIAKAVTEENANAKLMCSRKSQISEIESKKNVVENRLAGLLSSTSFQFDSTQREVAQLERLSGQLQQRLIQLQGCNP
jgi:chromosome segregation ATPase